MSTFRTLDRILPTLALILITAIVTARVTRDRVIAGYPDWALEPFRVDLVPLIERYGREKNSQNYEELIIRDFFQDKRDGVFLDVGASSYQFMSNTYYLETVLGWSGIAIEPQTHYAADYVRYRPRTRFVPMFASDVADQTAQLFVHDDVKAVASSTAELTERWGPAVPITVPTTTLNHVLAEANISTIDFLSMDVELHEPQALAGFDIARYRPALVCIEAHPEVRQAILDYFQRHYYVIIGKYLRADVTNLYFTPAR